MFYHISVQHIKHLMLEIEGSDSDFVGEIVVADPLLPRGSVLDKEIVR